jgi:hypothetical protein
MLDSHPVVGELLGEEKRKPLPGSAAVKTSFGNLDLHYVKDDPGKAAAPARQSGGMATLNVPGADDVIPERKVEEENDLVGMTEGAGHEQRDIRDRDDYFDIERELAKDLELEFVEISLMKFTSLQENMSVNSFGLWRLEGESLNEGGRIIWDGKYRLKNIKTGLYLRVRKTAERFFLELSKEKDNYSLFQFCRLENMKVSDDELAKFVTKDSFFHLKNCATGKSITFPDEKAATEEKKDTQEGNEEKYIRAPVVSDVSYEMDTFLMRRAEYEEIWEISFILSSLRSIQKTLRTLMRIDHITESNIEAKTQIKLEDRFRKFITGLHDLTDFSNNKLASNIAMGQDYDHPSPYRQQMLRELSVIGFLCWLLSKTFPNDEELKLLDTILAGGQGRREFSATQTIEEEGKKAGQGAANAKMSKRKRYEKFMRDLANRKYDLSLKIYEVITEMIALNKANQEYVFKFISILKRHIGYGEPVTKCLSVCFHNNDKLIYSLYKALTPDQQAAGISLLEEIVGRLKLPGVYMRCDIVDLLAKVCTCEGKAIFINQDKIFKLIFDHEDTRRRCTIDLHEDSKGRMIITFTAIEGEGSARGSNGRVSKKPSITAGSSVMKKVMHDQQDTPGSRDGYGHPMVEENSEDDYYDHEKAGLVVDMAKQGPGSDAFESFFNRGTIMKHDKEMSYLKSQLNMISSLCADRNYNNCEHFASKYSMPTLLKYFNNNDVPPEFKACMIALIRNIYVDTEPMTIKFKPNLVRTQEVGGEIKEGATNRGGGSMVKSHKTKEAQVVAIRASSNNGGSQGDNQSVGSPLQRADEDDQPLIIRKKSPNSNENGGVNSRSDLRQDSLPNEGRRDKETPRKNARVDEPTLNQLKQDLLQYLAGKSALLDPARAAEFDGVDKQNEIFNVCTLEVIRTLALMLKFGLFTYLKPKKENTNLIEFGKVLDIVKFTKDAEEKRETTELEDFVRYLAPLLEYDQAYFDAMEKLSIKRSKCLPHCDVITCRIPDHERKEEESLELE